MNNKRYLGDGVYVSYDGYHIVLTTEDGVSVQNTVYLDSDVMVAFKNYIDNLSSFIVMHVEEDQ